MAENRIINPRTEILKLEIARLINKLEGPGEFDFAIGALQSRRQELQQLQVKSVESRSREFLNQRWTIFGTQFEGPWPVAFEKPVTVRYQRAGIDFKTHEPFKDFFAAEVEEAQFVRLGRDAMTKYVELKVLASKVHKRDERERYGLKPDEEITVYCTLYQLIQRGPHWKLDAPTAAKIKRLQAIARDAVAAAGGAS